MPFRFQSTELPNVVIIEPEVFTDPRGFFMEGFKASDFARAGIQVQFVQTNLSYSKRGVLRGLHYQRPPAAQAKLVWVIQGAVYDVVVDLRHGSPTFGQWTGVVLSEENRHALFVPVGFAHGFCVISNEAYVLYQVTAEYRPELEAGIRWDDPDLRIDWPVKAPILSTKDAALPRFRDIPRDFVY